MLYKFLTYPSLSSITLFLGLSPPLSQEIVFLCGWTAIKLFIFKCNGFLLTSSVNDSSPPTLSHSNLLPCHTSPSLCKAKHMKRRSTYQSYPAPPIPRLTLISLTCSFVMTSSSSPRHLFSLLATFPSSSYSHSHVPHTLPHRLPPRLQNVLETTGLWCSLSLYEEDFNVYLQGVDLKTDATTCESGTKEAQRCWGFSLVEGRWVMSGVVRRWSQGSVDIYVSMNGYQSLKLSRSFL